MQADSLDPRTAFATGTPEGAHDHAGVIERVIKMGVDSPEVDTANAGNGRLSVQVPAPGSAAMIWSACSSSSVNTSGWSRLASHQAFSR